MSVTGRDRNYDLLEPLQIRVTATVAHKSLAHRDEERGERDSSSTGRVCKGKHSSRSTRYARGSQSSRQAGTVFSRHVMLLTLASVGAREDLENDKSCRL